MWFTLSQSSMTKLFPSHPGILSPSLKPFDSRLVRANFAMTEANDVDDNIKLKWVEYRSTRSLPFVAKLKSKFFENPFVFGGVLATISALSLGLHSLIKQDSKRQQKMMRFRVLAQGFTVGAVGVGLLLSTIMKAKDNNEEDSSES